MVWKNWFAFGLDVQEWQKFLPKISFAFLSCHYGSPGLQTLDVFSKIFYGAILEVIFRKKQILKAPCYLILNSLPYGLEQSRELRDLIRWVFGLADVQKCKKFLPRFFFSFLSRHYGFSNYFEILIFAFSNSMPRGVSNCKTLPFQNQYF